MTTEPLKDLEIVEETPTEQEPKKKKPGPCNRGQAAEFVVETNKSLDRFLEKMHNYKPYAREEACKMPFAVNCCLLVFLFLRVQSVRWFGERL